MEISNFGAIDSKVISVRDSLLNSPGEHTSRTVATQVSQIALYQMRREMTQSLVYEFKLHGISDESSEKESDELNNDTAVIYSL